MKTIKINAYEFKDLKGNSKYKALTWLDEYPYDYETGDLNPNPVPTKAMLRAIGQPAGPCRPPMGFGPDDLEERALAVHRRLYA